MVKKIVAGNWKMHGSKSTIAGSLQILQQRLASMDSEVGVIIFPPFVYLPLVADLLETDAIHYGAQTLSEYESGAYTGEVAGSMLHDYACQYVLVGHSERRALFAESNEVVAQKFAAAQQASLTPLLCVGETLAEREAGQTMALITQQLQSVIDVVGIEAFANAVVAYEPVWAIGTGETATPEQAQEVHANIRKFFQAKDQNVAKQLPLLYGGSVKANNAAALAAMPDVNGALVGGASLDANEFAKIVEVFK